MGYFWATVFGLGNLNCNLLDYLYFSGDIMGLLKKEKSDRQRDVEVLKDRVDNERKEMQILIDKDRDDTNKKLKEEHDQRRIEQMELVQRLDNNEKCGKTDITVSSQILFRISVRLWNFQDDGS